MIPHDCPVCMAGDWNHVDVAGASSAGRPAGAQQFEKKRFEALRYSWAWWMPGASTIPFSMGGALRYVARAPAYAQRRPHNPKHHQEGHSRQVWLNVSSGC